MISSVLVIAFSTLIITQVSGSCTKGEKCSKDGCAKCIPCLDGYYQDNQWHTETECKQCSGKPRGLHWKPEPESPCTLESDAVWTCEDGYEVKKVVGGYKGEKYCSQTVSAVTTTTTSATTTTHSDTTVVSVTIPVIRKSNGESHGLTALQILGIIGVIVGVIIGLVFYKILMYCRKKKKFCFSQSDTRKYMKVKKKSDKSLENGEDKESRGEEMANGQNENGRNDIISFSREESPEETLNAPDPRSDMSDSPHNALNMLTVAITDPDTTNMELTGHDDASDPPHNASNAVPNMLPVANTDPDATDVGLEGHDDAVIDEKISELFKCLYKSLGFFTVRSITRNHLNKSTYNIYLPNDESGLCKFWVEHFKKLDNPLQTIEKIKQCSNSYPGFTSEEFNKAADSLKTVMKPSKSTDNVINDNKPSRNYLRMIQSLLLKFKDDLPLLYYGCFGIRYTKTDDNDKIHDVWYTSICDWSYANQGKDFLEDNLELEVKKHYIHIFNSRVYKDILCDTKGQQRECIPFEEGEIRDDKKAFHVFRVIVQKIGLVDFQDFLINLESKEKRFFMSDHLNSVPNADSMNCYLECGLRWWRSNPKWDHLSAIKKCLKYKAKTFVIDDEEFIKLCKEAVSENTSESEYTEPSNKNEEHSSSLNVKQNSDSSENVGTQNRGDLDETELKTPMLS